MSVLVMGPDVSAVTALGRQLLDLHPDPVPRFRIWKDVLCLPASDALCREVLVALERHPHVRALAEAQLPEGTWGRFHTQDTSVKVPFKTTEHAIERALALGLDSSNPMLQRTVSFLIRHVYGWTTWSDNPEKHDNSLLWEYNIRYISAAYLALLVRQHPALGQYYARAARIAEAAFASGTYDREAELKAHAQIAGFESKRFRPSVDKYGLILLSAMPGGIWPGLEDALLTHVLMQPDGIFYSYAHCLADPPATGSRLFPSWLNGLEILSRFVGWPRHAAFAVDWLWEQRNAGEWWDFGAGAHRDAWSMLSDSWRDAPRRMIDSSVRVLTLLRRSVPG